MSTKRAPQIANVRRQFRTLGPSWMPNPGDPAAASTALAVTVALLRALRDRGLLTEGEIDDLFGEAAERFQDASARRLLNSPPAESALRLLDSLRAEVEHTNEE
jgi:hypothetical protein